MPPTRSASHPHTPTVFALAETLRRATSQAGCSDITPALTGSATAAILLGAPQPLARDLLRHLSTAEPAQAISALREVWAYEAKTFDYLEQHLDPLLGWTLDVNAESPQVRAFQACAAVLADVDVHAVVESGECVGDYLGPLYSLLRGSGGRRHLGAFFTPPSVATLLAAMPGSRERTRINEPACGSGSMVIAVVRDMRRRGLDPRTCHFTLIDIDALAVSLAGVNMAAHGIPFVELRVGDALTEVGP